jgi:hypothetical protein
MKLIKGIGWRLVVSATFATSVVGLALLASFILE